MSWLIPQRRFDPATPEFTDRPDSDPAQLREEMKLLEHLNRQSGGLIQPLRCLEQLLDSACPAPIRILDLGTGGADVPRAIVEWARERNLKVEITGVDRNPAVLACAREWSAAFPEVRFDEQDLLRLPYQPESFDIVMSSLALHHFTEQDAIKVLRSMHGLARHGYILNDLRRNWASVKLVDWLAGRYISNPQALYDARASSHAAFTVDELQAMAHQAGMTNFQIHRHNGVFRMALVGRK